MPDREKVIKGLIACTSDNSQAEDEWHDCENCPYGDICATGNTGIGIPVMLDAIALLKEQKMQKFFVDESGKITPLPIVFPNCPLKEYEAVVRCKDCKYGKIHGINVECIAHEEVGYDPEPWHPLDWFCADGEKRTD